MACLALSNIDVYLACGIELFAAAVLMVTGQGYSGMVGFSLRQQAG